MKVLICTVFDIDVPCAGLNRLTRMSKALKLNGIQSLIALGSGSSDMSGQAWKYFVEQKQEYVFFDKTLFTVKRHCNAMKIAATAAKFYNKHLSEIIHQLNIEGVIVYSPQYQLLKPFFEICKQNNVFILADCGENYSISIRHLLNGVIYQQFMFKKYQMRKLDGALISSPKWMGHTTNAKVPSCIVPGFLEPNNCYRKSKSVKSNKLIITLMGRFAGREKPLVIIKALKICKQNNLNFEVNLLGTGSSGLIEDYWLKKLTSDSDISDDISVKGFVSNNQRNEILSTSDIFIMLRPPNRETEYLYPSRVTEYLYSGNPVILTDAPSLNVFFQQGEGAYFISSKNDSNELAQLIIKLAENPMERFENGKRGRAYAIKNFSIDVMGKRLSEFINVITTK